MIRGLNLGKHAAITLPEIAMLLKFTFLKAS
jgi:hypothetical protein